MKVKHLHVFWVGGGVGGEGNAALKFQEEEKTGRKQHSESNQHCEHIATSSFVAGTYTVKQGVEWEMGLAM